MSIKVFINIDGDFIDKTEDYGLDKSNGLWNDIEVVDIDDDGDFDIIAANFGENNFYKPNMKMFVNDFDLNRCASSPIIIPNCENHFFG